MSPGRINTVAKEDDLIQSPQSFFGASSNGKAAAERGELTLGDCLDVPYGTIDYHTRNAFRFRGSCQDFTPGAGQKIAAQCSGTRTTPGVAAATAW